MYGRYKEKRHHAFRNIGSWTLNLVYRRIFGSAAHFSSFRLIRRELIDAAVSYQLNFTFIDGLLAWNTTRVGTVDVHHDARGEGRSGYSVGKLLLLALNLLTNFSLVPLQAATLPRIRRGRQRARRGLDVSRTRALRADLRSRVCLDHYCGSVSRRCSASSSWRHRRVRGTLAPQREPKTTIPGTRGPSPHGWSIVRMKSEVAARQEDGAQ